MENIYISTAAVSFATLELVGTEGLLVLDNARSAPRTVRVQVVLDR